MLNPLDIEKSPPLAILAALQTPKDTDQQLQYSLTELRRLCETLGMTVVGQISQKRTTADPGTVLGSGKVTELKALLNQLRAEDLEDVDRFSRTPTVQRDVVVVFDDGLSPSQTLHLSEALGAQVLDRNTLILEIFHRHARTRVAQVQVEIVRLEYQAPRVRTGANRSDRGGGIGAKGKGESHIEIDRRKIRDRIAELRIELAKVERSQEAKRKGRGLPQVALVGYTNAGKSTLMRALTESEVYVADKLFATLDTRIRLLKPATRPPILVSDTVGFIKKLPHGLINSFKATLDEALDASLLLHVVDASSEDWEGELNTTLQVLGEIGAGERPRQLIFNKVDKLTREELMVLRQRHPEGLFVSALNEQDIPRVHRCIWEYFQRDMVEAELTFGYHEHQFVHAAHQNAMVLDERHDENGTTLRIRTFPSVLETLRGKKQLRKDDEGAAQDEG